MTADTVISILRDIELVADLYALRVPGTSEYDKGRCEVALEIKGAIETARRKVEVVGVEATTGMRLFDFATLLMTMRNLQEISRKNPVSQSARANAARYELRVDTLVRKALTNAGDTQRIYLPL